MTDTQKTSLAGQLAARFGDTLTITTVRNETVAELAAADLVAV
ncbi:NADH-quinone oxidoreductase subunit C, partial [Rhodanobacter denitrificans]|nr:NADH-quinone oxidoreductase subunit C [Rhodanobacter denitrificans]